MFAVAGSTVDRTDSKFVIMKIVLAVICRSRTANLAMSVNEQQEQVTLPCQGEGRKHTALMLWAPVITATPHQKLLKHCQSATI